MVILTMVCLFRQFIYKTYGYALIFSEPPFHHILAATTVISSCTLYPDISFRLSSTKDAISFGSLSLLSFIIAVSSLADPPLSMTSAAPSVSISSMSSRFSLYSLLSVSKYFSIPMGRDEDFMALAVPSLMT